MSTRRRGNQYGVRRPKRSKLDSQRGLDSTREWLARLPFDYGQQRRRDDETPPEEVMPPGPEVPPA